MGMYVCTLRVCTYVYTHIVYIHIMYVHTTYMYIHIMLYARQFASTHYICRVLAKAG